MFRWRLPQAVCALSVYVCLILAYEDEIEVNYADPFYNEITGGETPEPTPSQAPCTSRELTKWDKLFSMLEDSQMRENMLLQYADDIIKVEMASLRGEMLRFGSQYGGSCGLAMETAGRRMALQLEGRLKETMQRLKSRDPTALAAFGAGAGGAGTGGLGGAGASGAGAAAGAADADGAGADGAAGAGADGAAGAGAAGAGADGAAGAGAAGAGADGAAGAGADADGAAGAGAARAGAARARAGGAGAARAGGAADAAGNSFWNSNPSEAMLQQLLSAARMQASRLAKLETSCLSSPGAGKGLNTKPGSQLPEDGGAGLREQEVTSPEVALDGVLAAMQQTRVELEEVLRSSRQRLLPAGCEMALLFPMRSRRIYTSVAPNVPLSISSFTVCMWVKPTTVSNKTVLFSYGNRRNPYEIQLLLGQTSAFFTVGGEAHLVEARDVVKPGDASEWIHLCGAWSSEQGLASLWAGGKKVASTPGVAEGHVIPDGGSLQLGQERNGCCPLSPTSGVTGFEGGFDPQMAFAGKMTGVNMWDKVLSEEEISQLALQEGQGCDLRGNTVAWGVTEMVPHGGAQFVN